MFDIVFSSAFNSRSADGAVSISQFHKNLNWIEAYIAYYDAGTAYIKSGDNEKAEVELRESISHNPPKDKICQVRVNLAYSLEMQADAAKNNGKYDDALIKYSQSEGILYEDNCANKQNPQEAKDENAQRATDRISQKRSNTVAAMNGNEGGNGGEQGSSDGLEITEQDAEALRNNLLDSNSLQDRVRSRVNGDGTGSIYRIQHW
jgi:tetratricopeptide (TPR) repeat protein